MTLDPERKAGRERRMSPIPSLHSSLQSSPRSSSRLPTKSHSYTQASGKKRPLPKEHGEGSKRFKYESLSRALEHVDVEHVFFKRSGFVGLSTSSSTSTWFWEGLRVYREGCLTVAFAQRFVPALLDALPKRKFRTLVHLLASKDVILDLLLHNISADVTLSSVDIFGHLLSLLVKDLGEELISRFPDIYASLMDTLDQCTLTEHCQYVLSALLFCLKVYIPHVDNLDLILQKIAALRQPVLRKVTGQRVLSQMLAAHPQILDRLLTVEDAKLVPLIVDVLSDNVDVLARLLTLPDKATSQAVCLRFLFKTDDDALLKSFWQHVIKSFPSTIFLAQMMALRRGSRVRSHEQLLDALIAPSSEPLLLALFLQSVPVDILYMCKDRFLQAVHRVDINTFVFILCHELHFSHAAKWTILSSSQTEWSVDPLLARLVDCPLVDQTGSIDWDLIPDSYAKQVALSLMTSDGIVPQDNILCLEREPVPISTLLMCLASDDASVVNRALLLISSCPSTDVDQRLIATLQDIQRLPITLDRYRERHAKLTTLSQWKDELTPASVQVLMWYALGACHVKLTLLLPAVYSLLGQLCSEHASLFADAFAQFMSYVSDAHRDIQVYSLSRLPPISSSKQGTSGIDEALHFEAIRSRAALVMSDVNVRFGEFFLGRISRGRMRYSFLDPAMVLSNVLKLLSNVPAACRAVDLNSWVHSHPDWNSQFAKAWRVNRLYIVKSYTQSTLAQEQVLLDWLASGDKPIQDASLKSWIKLFDGDQSLRGALEPLLDDKTYREGLVSSAMPALTLHARWPRLQPMLMHLIYGRLISRSKQTQMAKQRRKAFLTCIGTSWSSQDVAQFVRFLEPSEQNATLSRTTLGYLSLIGSVLQYIRLPSDTLDIVLGQVMRVLNHSDKRIRSLAMKRLSLMIGKYRDTIPIDRVLQAVEPMIRRLSQFLHDDSSLLTVLAQLAPHLDSQAVDALLEACKVASIKSSVLLLITQDILPCAQLDPSACNRLAVTLTDKVQVLKENKSAYRQLIPAILQLLVKIAPSLQESKVVFSSLTPLLSMRRVGFDVKAVVCRVLASILAANSDELDCVDGLLSIVKGNLIVNKQFGLMRDDVCRLLLALSQHRPELAASRFVDLFASKGASPDTEEPDYDRRLAVLDDVGDGLVALGCLQYVFYDARDLAMRNNCLNWLLVNMKACPSVYEAVHQNMTTGCRLADEPVHMDMMILLGGLIAASPPDSPYASLEQINRSDADTVNQPSTEQTIRSDKVNASRSNGAAIIENKDDADVFGDLSHLQAHRRTRALRQLSDRMPPGHELVARFLDWLLPWALDRTDDPVLQQEAQRAYSAILAKAPVQTQSQKLTQLVNRLLKAALKGSSSPSPSPGSSSSPEASSSSAMERSCLKLLALLLRSGCMQLAPRHLARLKTLLERYQHEIATCTSYGRSAKLIRKRIPLAVTLGSLALPSSVDADNANICEDNISAGVDGGAVGDNNMSSLACSLLISSLKKVSFGDIRQQARAGLRDIAIQKPTLLKGILTDIHHQLCSDRNNNYEQIGYFTIGTLLEAHYGTVRKSSPHPSQDDDALWSWTLRYLGDDLFSGSVCWQRLQPDWTGKVVEAKMGKALDVLGKVVLPADPAQGLLELLKHLRHCFVVGVTKVRSDPAKVSKLKHTLQRALNVLSHNLLHSQASFAVSPLPVLSAVSNPQFADFYPSSTNESCDHYWQLFGLQTSLGILKSGQPLKSDPLKTDADNRASSELILSDLRQTMLAHVQRTRHASLLAGCLKFASFLIDQLSQADRHLLLLKAFEIIVHVQGATNSKPDLACRSEAFKFVCTLLDGDQLVTSLTEQQVKALVVHCRAHFEAIQSQQMTFALIRRLIQRCVDANHFPVDLYLLMEDLQRAIVHHGSEATRQLCGLTLAAFLKLCPLAMRRRLEVMGQLQADAFGYHHVWGRTSALQALASAISNLRPLSTSGGFGDGDRASLQSFMLHLLAQCAHSLSGHISFLMDLHLSSDSAEVDDQVRALDDLLASIVAVLEVDSLPQIIDSWMRSPSEPVQCTGWYVAYRCLQSKKLLKASSFLFQSLFQATRDGHGLVGRLQEACRHARMKE